MLNILLASDIPIVTVTIAKSFADTPDTRIVAIARKQNDILPLVESERPQLAVLDMRIPWTALLNLLAALRKAGVSSMLISNALDKDQTIELLRAGLSGIIPRTVTIEMLHKCVHAIASGQVWISRPMVGHIVRQLQSPSQRPFPGSHV